MEDIDHTRTKPRSPQANGVRERFHKRVLNEFYRIAALRFASGCMLARRNFSALTGE